MLLSSQHLQSHESAICHVLPYHHPTLYNTKKTHIKTCTLGFSIFNFVTQIFLQLFPKISKISQTRKKFRVGNQSHAMTGEIYSLALRVVKEPSEEISTAIMPLVLAFIACRMSKLDHYISTHCSSWNFMKLISINTLQIPQLCTLLK